MHSIPPPPFSRILVDVDTAASEHPAVDRAVALAEACGATLTLVDVVSVPRTARPLPGGIEDALTEERSLALTRMAAAITGVPATTVLLRGRRGTALIQQVLRGGHDLLMRSHTTQPGARPRAFGAVDTELLRKCPCPVWLVRERRRPLVVGAVNASTSDETEHALNRRIVGLTAALARVEQAEAVVLHAWIPFGERLIQSHASAAAAADYATEVRDRTARELKALVASVVPEASGVRTSHRRGAPEDVIRAFVASHGADVVVMGSVARSGIAGLLFGNTAEAVIRKLPCSLLTLKPDGFECPVRLDP
ncbi:MAG: universal stress protein [Vicinamibacterales bacterium]